MGDDMFDFAKMLADIDAWEKHFSLLNYVETPNEIAERETQELMARLMLPKGPR
jgi:hypothetical protein